MKLKEVAVYQSVKFQNKQEMFFNADKPSMTGVNLEMTFDKAEGCIRIESDKDAILVFPTNVSYAKLMPAEAPKTKKA